MREVKSAELMAACFMLLHGFVAALNCTSPTPESLFNALEEELFGKQLIRPVKSFTRPVNVTLNITVVGIIGVDEKSQTLTTVLWQVLEWNIEGLSWDEEECGTRRVSVPREQLWIPDIHISEFFGEDQSAKPPYVYLYNTGHVFDDQPISVVSFCKLRIYTFPFDIQNCSLTFGSYLHSAADIRMIQGTTPEKILQESRGVLQTNGEWELADITVAHSGPESDMEGYSEIKYFIILRRRPVLYVMNLLIPSCFLITVDLFSFLLPPQSVDRSSFKMTLILGYTVFLLIINDLLPVTGEAPLINIFFSISLILMVFSLLETLFITNIQFSSNQYSAVPEWLSVLVLRYLAVVVFIPPMKKSNRVTVFFNPSNRVIDPTTNDNISSISVGDLQHVSCGSVSDKASLEPTLEELRRLSRHLTAIRLQVDKHFQSSNTSEEWQRMGEVIDRLLFGLYIIFISVSFIATVSIWALSYSYAAK